MNDCQQVFRLLASQDSIQQQEGMSQLYFLSDLSKAARYYFGKYETAIGSAHTWEDIHAEAFKRLHENALKGKFPNKNCRAYVRSTCRNICEELSRSHQKVFKIMGLLVQSESETSFTVIRQEVLKQLNQLGGQCERALFYYYLAVPPVTDRAALSAKLAEHKYQVQAGSIATILARCKRKLFQQLNGSLYGLLEEE